MTEKKKVINDFNAEINLNFKSLNGKVVNIAPKSYAFISEEELLYLSHSSTVLKVGLIYLDDHAEVAEDVKEVINEANVFNGKRYEQLLKCTVSKIEKELEKVTNVDGLIELKERAEKEDKAKGFIDAIDKRIDELVK